MKSNVQCVAKVMGGGSPMGGGITMGGGSPQGGGMAKGGGSPIR
jgi:hypothetical protein